MSGALYLAWRYLAHHRVKTAILVAAIALIAFLPAGLNVLVGESARELTARAEATPLLVGARGSPLSLALRALYFENPEFGFYFLQLASGRLLKDKDRAEEMLAAERARELAEEQAQAMCNLWFEE